MPQHPKASRERARSLAGMRPTYDTAIDELRGWNDPAVATLVERLETRRAEARRQPVRVVIVDRQRMFGEALAVLLALSDKIAIVGTAVRGGDGFDLAVAESADVVVIDVGLDGVDGLQTTKRLRAARPSTRVVVLSDRTAAEGRADALASGASAFLEKGTIGDEVIATILAA